MNRWLLMCLVLMTACQGQMEASTMSDASERYQTWGNSQSFDLKMGSPLPPPTQLIYAAEPVGRPDSWRFFFMATVNSASAAPWQLDVMFDVQPGLGRSTVQIPAFEHFTMTNVSVTLGIGLYSTSVVSPPKTPTELAAGVTHTIDQIVGENINCQVRFLMSVAAPGTVLNVTTTALFAPAANYPDGLLKQIATDAGLILE